MYIFFFQRCTAVSGGNIVSCKKHYPMTQTKCSRSQCQGVHNGMRSLVEDYNLKLVVYDLKTNKKMLITAYKKNIDIKANNNIPRNFGVGQADDVITAKLEHLKQGLWKINYWLKTPTKEGAEVTPIFIDCEQVEDNEEEME